MEWSCISVLCGYQWGFSLTAIRQSLSDRSLHSPTVKFYTSFLAFLSIYWAEIWWLNCICLLTSLLKNYMFAFMYKGWPGRYSGLFLSEVHGLGHSVRVFCMQQSTFGPPESCQVIRYADDSPLTTSSYSPCPRGLSGTAATSGPLWIQGFPEKALAGITHGLLSRFVLNQRLFLIIALMSSSAPLLQGLKKPRFVFVVFLGSPCHILLWHLRWSSWPYGTF